ncbi:MAG: YMGG-like glycine zipper-containing protein [Chitinophagaceae bacterium]
MKSNMKLMFVGVAMAGLMTACKQKGTEMTKSGAYKDTVGLAQFQQEKAEKERRAAEYNSAPVRTVRTTTNQPVTTTQPAARKKGWSKAAKGTAIGAGSGAILGAVINKKNRGVGAVVGGVVGGGVGYGVGRSKDKKDGRVQ